MRNVGIVFVALFLAGCSLAYRPIAFDPPPEGLRIPITSVPAGPRVRLAAVGDTGDDASRVAAGLRALHSIDPIDAIILLGDNVYPCGVSSETDPAWSRVEPLRIGVPIYPILGNHDYGNPVGLGGRTVVCGHPSPQSQVDKSGVWPDWRFHARNYRLALGELDVFLIDTTPIARGWRESFQGSHSSQVIKEGLAEALSESAATWKIVVGHHTIFSSGSHGRSDNLERRNMRTLLPILAQGQVDLYLCGHDHHLEVIGRNQQPQFAISGAGSRLRKIDRRSPEEPPTLFPPIPSRTFPGFLILDIDTSGSASRMTVEAFDWDGKAVEGSKFVSTGSSPISAELPR